VGGLQGGSGGVGIFEFEEFFKCGGVHLPASSFEFGALLSLREKAADVGESAGAAGRDAVGGECGEEFAEDVVDVDLSDEIAGGAFELGGEIVFARVGLAGGGAGVGEAEAVVFGVGGKATEASIGEFELAKVEDVGGSRVRHGAIIDEYIPCCQYTSAYRYEDFGKSIRMLVEKWVGAEHPGGSLFV